MDSSVGAHSRQAKVHVADKGSCSSGRTRTPAAGTCEATDVPPPLDKCSAFVNRGEGRRDAYVIASTTARFERAAAHLGPLGFRPKHFELLPRDHPRVIEFDTENAPPERHGHGPLGAISLSLAHAQLWRSFPTEQDWLYVFEDVVQPLSTADVQCMLDAAERMADRRRAPIIYAGSCSQEYPEKRHNNISHRVPVTSVHCATDTRRTVPDWMKGSNPHTLHVRPCAALCLHAYAIRRGPAQTLWPRMRDFMQSHRLVRSDGHRYSADVNLKNFFAAGAVPWQQWPVCILEDCQAVKQPSKGFFRQNSSMEDLAQSVPRFQPPPRVPKLQPPPQSQSWSLGWLLG